MVKPFARDVKSITRATIHGFFEALDTPLSLSCWLLYKYGEHSQLVRKSICASDYLSPDAFRLDYLAVKFLVKAEFLATGIDTRDVAKRNFSQCEAKCADTNERLVMMNSSNEVVCPGKYPGLPDLRFGDICHRLTGKIATVLKYVPNSDVLRTCSFGPGSTTRVKGTMTSAYEKLREPLHITPEALDVLPVLLSSHPRGFRGLELIQGNHVTYVPKNAKTDRAIAIEPDLNIYVQLGVGNYMRERLARVGVDLRDQTRNQRLARQASRTGDLATVDMSSASDLISQAAVMYLLPHPWYVLLDALRSHRYLQGDRFVSYNKFSSMGNGFTFPLQSLIFWAFAQLACDLVGVGTVNVAVYGDDVIVPVKAFTAFSSLLALFGFEVNSEKSFSSGLFRESCGKDYYDGVDCQPLYLKTEIASLDTMYKVHNGLVRLSQRFFDLSGFRSSRFVTLCDDIANSIPCKVRFRIPLGFGDGGLVSDFDQARPWARRAKNQIDGWFFTTVQFEPKRYVMTDSNATLLYALYTAGSPTPSMGFATHRRRTYRKHRKVLANYWPALGILL